MIHAATSVLLGIITRGLNFIYFLCWFVVFLFLFLVGFDCFIYLFIIYVDFLFIIISGIRLLFYYLNIFFVINLYYHIDL
jgi:hypothetical protein